MSDAELLESITNIARRAGEVILQVYATDFAVRGKDDASPVTQADEQAEALILEALAALAPGIPVVAEESAAAGRVPDLASLGGRFWLVDPLDGTKEFIGRNGEFTVNIALVERGEPLLGVVLAPALGPLGRLFGGCRGSGAFVEDAAGRRTIACRAVPDAGLTVVASRSHGDAAALDAFLAGRKGSPLVLMNDIRGLRYPGSTWPVSFPLLSYTLSSFLDSAPEGNLDCPRPVII